MTGVARWAPFSPPREAPCEVETVDRRNPVVADDHVEGLVAHGGEAIGAVARGHDGADAEVARHLRQRAGRSRIGLDDQNGQTVERLFRAFRIADARSSVEPGVPAPVGTPVSPHLAAAQINIAFTDCPCPVSAGLAPDGPRFVGCRPHPLGAPPQTPFFRHGFWGRWPQEAGGARVAIPLGTFLRPPTRPPQQRRRRCGGWKRASAFRSRPEDRSRRREPRACLDRKGN